MPSVTVVVPTHNRPALCEAAVRSALAQDPRPAEVLVCDDGSAGAAAERLQELEMVDPTVRVLRGQHASGGPAAPRNVGLNAATGQLVAFLDDDDEWLPGKLAAQLPLTEKFALVASNAVRTSNGEHYFAEVVPEPDHRSLLNDNSIITSTVVVRRTCLLAVGGFPERPSLHGVEDYAAWLALAAAGERLRVLDAPLARYRDEGDDRFAVRGTGVHVQLAGLHARRWLRKPGDVARLRAAAASLFSAARSGR